MESLINLIEIINGIVFGVAVEYFLYKMWNYLIDYHYKRNKDIEFFTECEKCHNKRKVKFKEFMKVAWTKSKKTTFFVNSLGVGMSKEHYKYLAKKIYCPVCDKKSYLSILDMDKLNETMNENRKIMYKMMIKFIIFISLLSFISGLFGAIGVLIFVYFFREKIFKFYQ